MAKSLKPGICISCGATISVDPDETITECPYCGKPGFADQTMAKFEDTYITQIDAAVKFAPKH